MMTRKHYNLFAAMLKRSEDTASFTKADVIDMLSGVFSEDNPRFDPTRFVDASYNSMEAK